MINSISNQIYTAIDLNPTLLNLKHKKYNMGCSCDVHEPMKCLEVYSDLGGGNETCNIQVPCQENSYCINYRSSQSKYLA